LDERGAQEFALSAQAFEKWNNQAGCSLASTGTESRRTVIYSPSRRLGRLFPYAVGTALAVLSANDALAAAAGEGPSEVLFLFQLVVLLLFGRLLGELMQQVGQPSVMGQLIAGIVLGPSVFGWAFPDLQHALFPRTPEQKAMIEGISQFGISGSSERLARPRSAFPSVALQCPSFAE